MVKSILFLVIFSLLLIPTLLVPILASETTVTISTVEGSGLNIDCGIINECYDPNTITVNLGDKILMQNNDTVGIHTFTSGTVDGYRSTPSGIFDSGILQFGDSFEYTVDTIGELPYYCMLHVWMQGMIVVNEPIEEPLPEGISEEYLDKMMYDMMYEMYAYIDDGHSTQQAYIETLNSTISVMPNLSIKVDKEEYGTGDDIIITGTVINPQPNPSPGNSILAQGNPNENAPVIIKTTKNNKLVDVHQTEINHGVFAYALTPDEKYSDGTYIVTAQHANYKEQTSFEFTPEVIPTGISINKMGYLYGGGTLVELTLFTEPPNNLTMEIIDSEGKLFAKSYYYMKVGEQGLNWSIPNEIPFNTYIFRITDQLGVISQTDYEYFESNLYSIESDMDDEEIIIMD